MLQRCAARCNAAQHAATQHSLLQRSTTRCNAVQHVADDWNGCVAVDCACAHERVSMQVCACKRTHASAHPHVHGHEPTPPPASAATRWVPFLCAASFVPNVVTSGPALQCPRPDCNTLYRRAVPTVDAVGLRLRLGLWRPLATARALKAAAGGDDHRVGEA